VLFLTPKSLLSKICRKGVEKTIALFYAGSLIAWNTGTWLSWIPDRYRALKFFEVGKIYEFRGTNPWLNLWKEGSLKKEKGSGPIPGKPLKRLPPGSVFLVLGIQRLAPDHLIIKIFHDETPGCIVLLSNTALKPWNSFLKFDTTRQNDNSNK